MTKSLIQYKKYLAYLIQQLDNEMCNIYQKLEQALEKQSELAKLVQQESDTDVTNTPEIIINRSRFIQHKIAEKRVISHSIIKLKQKLSALKQEKTSINIKKKSIDRITVKQKAIEKRYKLTKSQQLTDDLYLARKNNEA